MGEHQSHGIQWSQLFWLHGQSTTANEASCFGCTGRRKQMSFCIYFGCTAQRTTAHGSQLLWLHRRMSTLHRRAPSPWNRMKPAILAAWVDKPQLDGIKMSIKIKKPAILAAWSEKQAFWPHMLATNTATPPQLWRALP